MTFQKILTRDFILAFWAQLAFSFSYFTLLPTFPVYLSRMGITEAEIGVLVGTFSISSLLLRPFVGRALLNIPERNFMMGGSALFVLSFFIYLLARPFWPLLVLRFFHGMGIAFFYTAATIFITNITPEGHRGQSIGYFFVAFNVAFALAPSFGMFIANRFGFPFLFLVGAVMSSVSLFLTTRLKKEPSVSPESPPIERSRLFSREALPVSFMAFFTHIIWGALTAFFPLYALEQGVKNPGIFFTVFAIMLILGRVLGGKVMDQYSREKVMLPCLITYILSMVILSFSKTLSMFILVAIIWGIGNAFLIPTLVAYAIDRAGSSRGPAMGTYSAVSDLGVGLGAVIMGVVLRLTSYPVMFLCLALIGGINFCYFYFYLRKKAVQ